jgi:hypothetical protein
MSHGLSVQMLSSKVEMVLSSGKGGHLSPALGRSEHSSWVNDLLQGRRVRGRQRQLSYLYLFQVSSA